MNPLQEKIDAVGEVAAAWTDPGPIETHHEYMKAKLRHEWPALAKALDKLCYQ